MTSSWNRIHQFLSGVSPEEFLAYLEQAPWLTQPMYHAGYRLTAEGLARPSGPRQKDWFEQFKSIFLGPAKPSTPRLEAKTPPVSPSLLALPAAAAIPLAM